MVDLKLAKLPNRTPVKMTITRSPDLNQALGQYADEYTRANGNTTPEPPSELVSYIIQSLLESDRAFVRAQKLRERENGPLHTNSPSGAPRRSPGSETSSNGG